MDTSSNWFKYLTEERQLTSDVINEAKLEIELGRLRIPIFDKEGNELFAKLRRPKGSDVGPKYMYQKGANAALYGWHLTDYGGKVYFTEGELDTLAMSSIGATAFSSTGGAMTFRDHWLEDFKDREKVIAFDNDETGLRGAVKLAFRMKEGYFTWVPPAYGKDIGDLLQVMEPKQVKDLMTDEKRMVHFVIDDSSMAAKKKTKGLLHAQAQSMEHSVGQDFLLRIVHNLHLMTKTTKRRPRHENIDNAVQKAKDYPIENLIPIKPGGKIKCLWHKEKTGSLHLYKDNHLYCHGGCDRAYDAIDVYMHQNNMSFMDAVNELARL